MGLADFKDVDRNELSMIEVAHAILEDRGERMAFADIVNEMQKYLNKSDEEIRQRLPQFYTDMNTDGRFISMGENVWALRTWLSMKKLTTQKTTATKHQLAGTTGRSTPSWPRLKAMT